MDRVETVLTIISSKPLTRAEITRMMDRSPISVQRVTLNGATVWSAAGHAEESEPDAEPEDYQEAPDDDRGDAFDAAQPKPFDDDRAAPPEP